MLGLGLLHNVTVETHSEMKPRAIRLKQTRKWGQLSDSIKNLLSTNRLNYVWDIGYNCKWVAVWKAAYTVHVDDICMCTIYIWSHCTTPYQRGLDPIYFMISSLHKVEQVRVSRHCLFRWFKNIMPFQPLLCHNQRAESFSILHVGLSYFSLFLVIKWTYPGLFF